MSNLLRCAGHDPVLFSGQFDDPDYDIENHETAHAGITCTVCHAITDVPSTKGNAHYVITNRNITHLRLVKMTH